MIVAQITTSTNFRAGTVDPAHLVVHEWGTFTSIAGADGTVHLLFCLEYMRSFYQRSEDDGVSWSVPGCSASCG